MRYGQMLTAASLLVVAPLSPGHATDPPEVPDPPRIVREALTPGSDLFDRALDLLEYDGEITAEQARSATSAATSVVTYSKPLRTAFLELDENASGPLTDKDFFPLPDRYIAVQYVDNKPQGAYTVDVNGEFIQMGGEEEEVLAAFEKWPEGAIYGTDGIIGVSAEISADGSTVRALDNNTRELFGQETLTADEFRTIAAQANAARALEDDYSPGVSPFVIIGVAAALSVGIALVLQYRRPRDA